jgi:hypothetical protein
VRRSSPPQLPGMRKASVGESIEVDTSTSSSPSVFDHTSDSETSERDSTLGSNDVRPVRDKSPILTTPEVSSGRHSIAPTMKESSSASTVTPYPRSFYSSIGSQAKYSPYPTSTETSVIRSAAQESTIQRLIFRIHANCNISLTDGHRWEEVVANSSLDEFFDFFADVSGTELHTMSELTFQLNFEDFLSFTIPRHGGRIVWDTMKSTVAGVFMGWKRKNPEVMEFSITVKAS